ncbi:efflux RND transporter permease subunit [Sphingobacterium sp. 18053]|uniref:efflux RND transporter permease subunit n=1 Tax=Sphingobacterium sp. 18053 TaxID=2681401 RepID=UPI0013573336|nr:efflux RND transporter permease subunit [Sphingobacterium sp. 18053]
MVTQKDPAKFSAFSIIIIFVLFFCIGALFIPKLSVKLLPSKTFASLTLSTTLWGASTEITEQELTTPLESALSRLKGVTNISSFSDNGRCQIKVQLDKWTDPDIFRFEVSALIRQLYPKLPDNTSYPQIYLNQPEEDKRNQPMLYFTLSGKKDVNDIARFVDEEIRPVFTELKGIHKLEVTGDRPIHEVIVPDLEKMHSIGISLAEFQDQLQQGFLIRELGKLKSDGHKFVVFLDRSIKGNTELLNFPIKNTEGRILKVADLASVSRSETLPNSKFRINGDEQVALLFYPEENTNNILLAANIKQKLKTLELNKKGYLLKLQVDQTEFIKDELNKIYTRTGLSVFILLLFVMVITRRTRYVVIILISLLANVLLSSIFYYLFSLDIHLYSLAGITISLGLVIDNVIVIVEDIRHTGKNRIFSAILASTLTALGALSVIFLLEENQKMQLIDFALAVIVNLIISLPIAYFFIPAMLDLFPVQIKKKKYLYKRKRILVRLNSLYARQLAFFVRYKIVLIILFILSFGIPIYLLPTKIENEEYFWQKIYNGSIGSDFYIQNLKEPINKAFGGILYFYISDHHQLQASQRGQDEQTRLIVTASMPFGAELEQMDLVCKEFENLLQRYSTYLSVFTVDISDPTSATINILFRKGVKIYIPIQLKKMLERQAMLSGSADFSITGVGKGFSNALDVEQFDSAITLRGYNYQQLQNLGMLVMDSLNQYKRVREVMISSQRIWGQNTTMEHIVRFNKSTYLALNGIGRWNLENSLSDLAERSTQVGTYEDKYRKSMIQVDVHQNEGDVPKIWAVKNRPFQFFEKPYVKFSTISDISKVRIGNKVFRENQEYVVYVNYQFIGTYELNNRMCERIVSAMRPQLPYGYKMENAALVGKEGSAFNYLWFIPLVILIIYMICAVLLESLKQPIAVIAMIPFSYIGVFLTYQLLGLQFDQGGYVALLMLSGLVTNSALYIMNDLNFISEERVVNIQHFIGAFNLKAMPIMITTASAILSLLPFMISGGEKGFWFTLSAGTIGGLLFSILGAYVLLPILLIPNKRKSDKYD